MVRNLEMHSACRALRSGNGSIVKVSGIALAGNAVLEELPEKLNGGLDLVEGADVESGRALNPGGASDPDHLIENALGRDSFEGRSQTVWDRELTALGDVLEPGHIIEGEDAGQGGNPDA